MKNLYTKILILISILAVLNMSSFSEALARRSSSKGLPKEEVEQIESTVNTLVKKVYARGLFSPEDNASLVETKLKLDNVIQEVAGNAEFAKIYYNVAFICKEREFQSEAVEYFKIIMENFSESHYALKATDELKKMGIKIEENTEEEY